MERAPNSEHLGTPTGLMRAIGAVALVLIGGVLALIALSLVLLDIAPLRHAALQFVLAEVNKGDTKIAIGDIGGSWPDTLVIEKLAVSDTRGTWLTLDSANLDWRPASLLAGEVHVVSMTAEGFSIARTPESATPSQETNSFSLPVLPFALRIDDARINGLTLGRALAEPGAKGTLARLDAAMKLALSKNQLALDFSAKRTDDVPGSLDAQAFVDGRGRLATLHLDAMDGAADKPGLIATLGHVEGASRIRVVADVRSADGAVEGHAGIDGGRAVSLDASAQGRWDAEIDLNLTAHAEGTFVHSELAALGKTDTLRATGQLQWTRDDTLSFNGFSIDAGGMVLRGDAHLGTVSVAAKHELKADGTLVGLDAVLGGPDHAALASLGWHVAGKLDMLRGVAHIADATVTALPGQVRFSGDAGFDGSIKGAGEIVVDDASALESLIGQKVAGRADLTLAPFAIAADGSGAGDFTLRSELTLADDALLNRLFGGNIDVDGSLLFPKEGGIAFPSLTVTPASGAYRLRATVAQGATDLLSGEARFDVADMTKILPGSVTGALNATATISGSTAKPRLALSAKLSRGSLGGMGVNLATLNAVAASGDKGPLALDIEMPQGKAALTATLALPDAGGANLGDIAADIFGAKLEGAFAISDTGFVSGGVKGKDAPLKPFSDFAGLPLDGSGDIVITADAMGGKQNAKFSLSARRLDVDPGIALTLDHAALDFGVTDLFGSAETDATFTALSGDIGITHLTHVAAGAHGPLDKLHLATEVAGMRESFSPQPISFSAEAQLDSSASTMLALSRLHLALGEATLTLAKPATIGLDGKVTAKGILLDMKGASGGGRLSASLTAASRAATLHVEGDQVPLDLAALLMPIDTVRGAADGKVDLDTARGTGTLAIRFGKVAISQEQEGKRPAFDATLDGTWAKSRLDIKAHAQGVSTKPFELTASVPVVRDPKGAWPVLGRRGAVRGSLTWEGPLASLVALIDIGDQQIAGDMKVALTADGDVSAPQIGGSASLSNGTYENFDSGTILKNLSLRLEGSRSENLNFALDASDGDKGKVAATGSISLAKNTSPTISVAAHFADAHLVRRGDADISVDGTLELTGAQFPPTSDAPLALEGMLTTTDAQIRIPDSLAASIPEIDVVEINGLPSRKSATETESSIPLGLDVGLKIGKPMRISGRGLDSLWTGELQATGPVDEPAVTGVLTSLRGALDFAGKTFTLSKGSVRFLGEMPINPYLDIELDYKRSDLAAAVSVTGQSSAPAIDLSSTPDLPRDELLSRILFNKGVGELSATEAVQLANTLAQLSGTGFGVSGAGILDKVQQSLGLDVLRVDSAQSGATTLAAGKYIEKGVYIGVEQGALASDSSVKVEINVTPQISVDTKLGQNATGEVGVNWKWDY